MTCQRMIALCALFLCATGAEAGSRISIMKMGGDIVIDDASSGACLRTMGGDITIGRANGEVVAKTMGGDIDVRELVGHLDAGSMGGSIRVHVVGSGGGHDISLHSMGGNVEITLPHDFEGTFLVKIKDADQGRPSRIISDIPLTQSVTEHWSLFHGKTRTITASKSTSTRHNRVEITTYSSDVTIRRE